MTKEITNQPAPRRLSGSARPSGNPFRMVYAQARAEFLAHMREPEFLIGIVAIPVMLFLMFGLPNASQKLPGGSTVGTLMMASFSAYGLLSLAIFSFGVAIAQERGGGRLKLMRATPMPTWVFFAGKLAMSLIFGVLMLLVMFTVGYLLAGVRMPLEKWLSAFGVLLLGGLSFSTLGFALAYWSRPRAASTIANLIYLPLSFVSGFFFPLSNLPEFLQNLAPYLPTYHFGQWVWGTVGNPEAAKAFTGIAPGSPLEHTLWLIGSFAFFGILAYVGYRRDRGESVL